MSYILDALKKSDRERQRQTPTSLVTPQSEFRARGGGAPPYAVTLMVVALVIAAGAGGALLARSWREPPAPAVEPPVTAAVTPATDARVPASPAPAVMDQPAPEVPVEDISVPAPALLEIWQLTEAEQRYLGALDVSMHVHAADPAQRTVIVNGLRVREGQALGQDIRLLEITPDGMIVEFQGKHVHLVTVQGA